MLCVCVCVCVFFCRQGFATGDAEADAYAIRKFVADGHYVMLSQSFAKNFGLYGERVGLFSMITGDAEECVRVTSQASQLHIACCWWIDPRANSVALQRYCLPRFYCS